MDILLFAAAGYALMVATWVLYLAIMGLAPHRERLHPVAKFHAYALLGIGLVLDFLLNVVVCSVLFLKYPQNVLLTGRLKRYIRDPHERPWRRNMAAWLCRHLLDQFDPSGCHCDCD